ncbi:MAG: acylphosphatase [Euryarchaeota archaeon]|nr:acylphosphatase [Euryarchaeota archaeon]
MKRAVIIAKGKVQKVGYRDFVQDNARELGITGYVENLGDGNVKVVGEGEEPEIEDFIRGIKVKRDFIGVVETSVKYEAPTGEFKLFKIKYGGVPEELGDRLGAALLYLSATNQKIDAGREENKQGFDMLGGKIDAGREESKQGFDMLAGKMDGAKEEIVTEISSLRGDLKSYMENKFSKIEQEIEGIKAKIGMV